MLSRKSSLIKVRWDSMVDPCSTISMVIKAYEMQNRAVSNGSQPRRLRGTGASIGAAVVISVLPNNVVKVHPNHVPLPAGLPLEMHLARQRASLK